MLRAHHGIGLCTLALLTLGLVMVNSAGMGVSESAPTSPAETLRAVLHSRPAIYAMIALAALAVVWAMPIRSMLGGLLDGAANWRGGERDGAADDGGSAVTLLALATLVLVSLAALVYIPGLTREVNGSKRWLLLDLPGLGATSAQPSEFVKWLCIPLLAWFCVAQRERMASLVRGGGPAMLALGAIAAIIAKEDLGTGVLIAAAGGCVLLAGGLRLWQAALAMPVGAAGVALAVWDEPYRFERLKTFLDPYADPQDAGYHMIQSMAAIAGGGGPGRGLGNGLQKFGYLPEDQTDFLFAIICEELGIAGALLVCGLLAACLVSVLTIAWKERNPFAQLIVLGVGITLGLQAIINLFVVTGLAPTKGIPLPLVSSGGTGWILTAASLGVVMSIGRTQPVEIGSDDSPADQAEGWAQDRTHDWVDEEEEADDWDEADPDETTAEALDPEDEAWDDDGEWDNDESDEDELDEDEWDDSEADPEADGTLFERPGR